MNRLFIHNPLFRLISPLCSGTLVYLLILLINNNVGQLKEQFLGQELYVCIALAYIIQEYSKLSLVFFKRLKRPKELGWRILIQLVLSVLVCVALVTLVMNLYFKWFLGYTPNFSELTVFNSIFSVITVIYLSMYLSHEFLHKVNTEKLTQELALKKKIEQDFLAFKRGINPDLLFESLESLIVLMKKDQDEAEVLVDRFSSLYRYILSRRNRELVPIAEELEVADELLQLFDHLSYRKTRLRQESESATLIIPGSILYIIEQVIRSTIPTSDEVMYIGLTETENYLQLRYLPQEKITQELHQDSLADIMKAYEIYTHKDIKVESDGKTKNIQIPKLTIHESSDH